MDMFTADVLLAEPILTPADLTRAVETCQRYIAETAVEDRQNAWLRWLSVFAERVRKREIGNAAAGDNLREIAQRHGLVAARGEDWVQARLADAFAKHPRKSGHVNGLGKSHESMETRNQTQARTSKPQPFPFVTFKEIDPSPRKDWLIEDILGAGEMSVWFGAPGSGKSVAIGDAACHVAAEKGWHGKRVMRGAVLYIAAERGGLVKRRMAAWRKHHGISEIPLVVVDGLVDLRASQVDANRIAETAKAAGEGLGVGVVWIIIDTVHRVLAGGDENGPKDMGALINSCDLIQRQTAAHVSLVHHVPHSAPDRMRGHGGLLGACDTTILTTKPDGKVLIEIDKANDVTEAIRFGFEFVSVLLSTDPDTGKETTAPILVPAELPVSDGKGSGPKLQPHEEMARRILAEEVAETGGRPPIELPANIRAIKYEAWRDSAYAAGFKRESTPTTRRKSWERTKDKLVNCRIIGFRDDWVWLATRE
jgi:AAA domain